MIERINFIARHISFIVSIKSYPLKPASWYLENRMIRKFYTDRITDRIAYYYLTLTIFIYSRIKIGNKITVYIYSISIY